MSRVRMPGLLDGELQEVARLRVRAGQYQLSADDVSQATLTIPEDGPAVGLRDWVSLYDVDGLMGIYRVTNIAQTVKRSIQLTLLHGIDILADSYWAEEREYTGSVRGYLEALLQQQTALIDGTAPWALGDCEDTETQLKVKISYGRLSELIREAVPEGGGYQLEYDQTVWPWRVHLRAKPTAAAAEFRVARNITSATITYNDADLCTRLILSNTSGGESRVRVYNAGAIAQAEWGIVTKTASIDTSDTLTSDSWPEAEAWVAAFFALHAAPSVQIQIEGRELYRLTGDRWDRASLGRVCRVSLPEYGHTFEERVVSLTYPDPWGDPDRVVVSLANALPQFSGQVKLIEKTAQSASRAAGGAARKADQTAEELERKEVIYQTSFQKTDREIAGIASATGLQFNADGTPVLDEDGNFVYSEEHPDNALIAQISLQAGRYDRIIQATGISETPSQGEVSLVTQISQTHQQISNAAIATGLIWVDGDPTADPPTEGHYEINPNAVASSLYKQLANQIDQKVTVSDLESKVSTAGFIKLQAAKDAASAVLGANLTDGNGQITAATIVAAIKDNTSLISAIADKISISASKVNISGNVNLNDVITVGTNGAVGTFNSLTINGGANLGSSNVYYNNVPLSSFIKSISLTGPTDNVYTLTWENAGGTPTSKTFSRAASGVSVSWSGTSGTVTVQPQNQQFSITYDGPSGQSVDAITIENNPITATLSGTNPRLAAGTANLTAWHNEDDGEGQPVQTRLKDATARVTMNIESILSSAEGTAAANAKSTALAGVKLSGWQLNSSSHDAENIVRDADNNDLKTVSLPTNWDISVGAFNSSGSATITVRPVIGGSNGTQVATGTIADSNLKPENIKSGVTIFGKTGTYTGSGGPSVSSVGLYFDNEGLEDVTTPFSVDNDYTVYPIAKMSDGTRRVGSAVRLTTTISLYDVGTITPTSSAQTIAVPTGYAGFAGPLRIAAASGGSSYSNSAKLNRNTELYIKDGSSYYPLSALNLYGYTSANTYTQIPSGTTVHW